MTLRVPEESHVPAVFALLWVGALVYDAAHGWFWQRSHNTAPIGAVAILLLVALLLRRSRFAWWVFLSFGVIGLVTWPLHAASHHVTVGWIVGGLVGVGQLVLLASPQMRRFVRLRGRLAPAAN
jgi:hypothetical protein